MATEGSDSEATADEEVMEEAGAEGEAAGAGSDWAPPSNQVDAESEEDVETETETGSESEEEVKRRPGRGRGRGRGAAPSRRSRASSLELAGGDTRLTARQRSRMQKEAGLATDVAWHEMPLPSELEYKWKGDKRYKAANQLTEEEWLKRQEALERRRNRSQRDKRDAEESVKAKIRKAVSAKFRGRLLGPEQSGADGEAAAGDAAGGEREVAIRPGWVRVVAGGCGATVTWPARAPDLSLPAAVTAPAQPGDPVDLPLQPCGPDWSVPSNSEASFRLGASLALRPAAAAAAVQAAASGGPSSKRQRSNPGREQQQQLVLVDQNEWQVGCLEQQEVVDALLAAGHMHLLEQQQQQQLWQQWRAVVKSIRRRDGCLAGVTVRLLAAPTSS